MATIRISFDGGRVPVVMDVLEIADGISGGLVGCASANSALVFQDFVRLLTDDRDRLVPSRPR